MTNAPKSKTTEMPLWFCFLGAFFPVGKKLPSGKNAHH
jgi:hypothetical protein